MTHPDVSPEARAYIAGHEVGDVVDGSVAEHVPFGVFVELGGGVHGLVHESEIRGDWPAVGEPLRTAILALDPERGRVALRRA